MVISDGALPALEEERVVLTLDSKESYKETESSQNSSREAQVTPPWWTGPVLFCAICAVSSAAAAFKYIAGAAPITRAAWRLQGTTLVVSPVAWAQWRRLEPKLQERAKQPATLSVLALSGASLAVHFGLWVYSIDHTSIPHSLLLVCSAPVILTIAYCLTCRPISWGEIAGVGLGACGAVLLSFASKSDKEVTFVGDAAAFLAAAAFCVYITCGKSLREWLPLFCYTLPVSLVAALLLTIAGIVLEGAGGEVAGQLTGPIAYLTHPAYILPVIYLALGPGIVGHAGLNAVLKYMSPLSLSLAVCVEPLLGSLIGWGLHVSALPGLYTWWGGLLLVVATVITQVAGQQRESGPSKAAGDRELVLVPLSEPHGVAGNVNEKPFHQLDLHKDEDMGEGEATVLLQTLDLSV